MEKLVQRPQSGTRPQNKAVQGMGEANTSPGTVSQVGATRPGTRPRGHGALSPLAPGASALPPREAGGCFSPDGWLLLLLLEMQFSAFQDRAHALG